MGSNQAAGAIYRHKKDSSEQREEMARIIYEECQKHGIEEVNTCAWAKLSVESKAMYWRIALRLQMCHYVKSAKIKSLENYPVNGSGELENDEYPLSVGIGSKEYKATQKKLNKIQSNMVKLISRQSGVMPATRGTLRSNEEFPFCRMPYPDGRNVIFDNKNFGVVAIKTRRKRGKNQR